MTPTKTRGDDGPEEALARRLERQARRRARSNGQRGGGLWRQIARVGTLGWMIVLPIVGGVILGHLLDTAFDTGIRWALALLFLGVLVGGYSLWRAMQDAVEESDQEH